MQKISIFVLTVLLYISTFKREYAAPYWANPFWKALNIMLITDINKTMYQRHELGH